MELRNCKRCGKMYTYVTGIPICDQCKQKDEDDFQKVKKYINENRNSSMKEISEACEVSVEKITRFLREGRLEIRENANIVLECEDCGTSIMTGRFCQQCSKKLERELSRVSTSSELRSSKEDRKEEEKKHKGAGMRYLKS